MPNPKPTARDLIRASAATNGWTVTGTSDYHDRFVRAVELPDGPLARMFAQGEITPTELIVTHYDELGRVSGLVTSTPGGQALLDGKHVDVEDYRYGGKRAAALGMLAIGVVSHRIAINAAHGITEVVA